MPEDYDIVKQFGGIDIGETNIPSECMPIGSKISASNKRSAEILVTNHGGKVNPRAREFAASCVAKWATTPKPAAVKRMVRV